MLVKSWWKSPCFVAGAVVPGVGTVLGKSTLIYSQQNGLKLVSLDGFKPLMRVLKKT